MRSHSESWGLGPQHTNAGKGAIQSVSPRGQSPPCSQLLQPEVTGHHNGQGRGCQAPPQAPGSGQGRPLVHLLVFVFLLIDQKGSCSERTGPPDTAS